MADHYQCNIGGSFNAVLDLGTVLVPVEGLAPGYPRVRLMEGTDVLQTSIASPQAGIIYETTVVVPAGISLASRDFVSLRLVWEMVTTSGARYREIQQVQAVQDEAKRQFQSVSMLLAGGPTKTIQLMLDFQVDTGNPVTLNVYDGNESIGAAIVGTGVANRGESSVVSFNLSPLDIEVGFAEYNLIISGTTNSGSPFAVTNRLYYITPSMSTLITELRSQVAKSGLDNVIKALNYTDVQLLEYLRQGLSMFNMYPPILTNITGTNLMGGFRDAVMTCAKIKALSAQYGAENDLDFDLAGQSVTLRFDRKSGLDSILGRLEADLDRVVKPFKILLGKSGALGGDGSGDGAGNPVRAANAVGIVATGQHALLNTCYRNPGTRFHRRRPY